MSLYNSPKEHKLRKPRAGFEKIKQQQWDDLNASKEEHSLQPTIELSEQAEFRIKKKKQRSFFIQVLIGIGIFIPITILSVNMFFKQVESTHKILAPHHYRLTQEPPDDILKMYLRRGYKTYLNKEYQKSIFSFEYLKNNYAVTTFAICGLISSYDELCKENKNPIYCNKLQVELNKYKKFYGLQNEKDKILLKEIKTYHETQAKRFLNQ